MDNAQVNRELLAAIAARETRKTLGGHGIRSALDYVAGVVEAAEQYPTGVTWRPADEVKRAQSRLVYSNEECRYDKDLLTTSSEIDQYCKALKVERPPRTLMMVDVIVTTPKKDRDGDILRTEGAIVDPVMPGLWHHMLPMPVGKMLAVLQHNAKRLKIATAVMDSLLGHDVATMLDFGVLRISHGFRPLKFEPLQTKEGELPGYDIKVFEVMEYSFVTVPSNTDAVPTAVNGGKLHHPLVKRMAKEIEDSRPVVVPGWSYTVSTDSVDVKSLGEDIETAAGEIANKAIGGSRTLGLADKGKGWDGDGATTRLRRWAGGPDKEDIDWAKYRRGFVWYDPDNADSYGGYKLPFADVEGGEAKAVWRGVSAAMGAVNGARGGVDIPDSDRRAAYGFLASYYRRFDEKPPDFRDEEPDGKAVASVTVNLALTDEAKAAIVEMEKAGRVISKANEQRLKSAQSMAARAGELIKEVLDQLEKPHDEPNIDDGDKRLLPRVKAPDPIRWQKSLSSTFDVDREHLEASKLEYEWVSRYIGCQVKQLFNCSTLIPTARMGTWLTGLRHQLVDAKLDDTRSITYSGKEEPPCYEIIQLNSTSSDEFLVDGIEFYRYPGPPQCKLVVKRTPTWRGLWVDIYTAKEHRATGRKIIDKTWEWSKQNNFLRGEAFSLSGDFIKRTEEGWGDLFLTEKNIRPITRTVAQVNTKKGAVPNRGIILMGPPGTGKTLSGRIIRNTCDSTFIWISSRDFYYSGVFGSLTYGFDLAKELKPCVLFIEDVDNWMSSTSTDLLKTEMDGIGRSTGVVTVLTTNYPERLPEALIDRPGRFHDVLKLNLPDDRIRKAMLGKWLPEISDRTSGKLVKQTDGYSGAHIYELAYFARSLSESEEIGLDDASVKAMAKIREQRELINEAQLEGSNYRPRARMKPPERNGRLRDAAFKGVQEAMRRAASKRNGTNSTNTAEPSRASGGPK